MNHPPDPYAMLWQELAPLRHLLRQVEVLLAILAGYALLLFSAIALLLLVAGLNAVVERIAQRRAAPATPASGRAAPARPPARGGHGPQGTWSPAARPIAGVIDQRQRSVFSLSLHRNR